MNRTIFTFSKKYRICIKACLHVEKFLYPSLGQRENNWDMTTSIICNYLLIEPYVIVVTGTGEVWILMYT